MSKGIDYYERIDLAIRFMERHLREPIQVADVSAAAFTSQWHFQRVFRYMTDCSVAAYLRRRRLSEAGHALILRKTKVLDVALEFQYESPESFSRAFQKEFGVNPGRLRRSEELPFFAPIHIYDGKYHDVYPDVTVEERIVVRNDTIVEGLRNRTSMRDNRNFQDIPVFWGEFFGRDIPAKIAHPSKPGTAMGVYSNWDFDENFELTIGLPVDAAHGECAADLVRVTIPAGKFAVFTIPGSTPYDLVAGWKYIYGTWMPNTQTERAYGIDFDLFDERFTGNPDSLSEIYIPVV